MNLLIQFVTIPLLLLLSGGYFLFVMWISRRVRKRSEQLSDSLEQKKASQSKSAAA